MIRLIIIISFVCCLGRIAGDAFLNFSGKCPGKVATLPLAPPLPGLLINEIRKLRNDCGTEPLGKLKRASFEALTGGAPQLVVGRRGGSGRLDKGSTKGARALQTGQRRCAFFTAPGQPGTEMQKSLADENGFSYVVGEGRRA